MVFTALFSAGSNAQGQLAQGTEEDSHCFRRCIFSQRQDDQLSSVGKVLSVAAGANHTLVLSQPSDGKTQLWGCGDSRRGQLGHRYQVDFGSSSILHRIDFPELEEYEIIAIAASWETSFVALSHADAGDVLLSMGSDDYGDLGVGGSSQRKEGGSYHRINFGNSLPFENQGLIRILELRAGPHNAVALLSCEQKLGSSTTVVTVGWGASRHGQLGAAGLLSKKPQLYIPTPTIIPIHHVRSCAVGNQHIVFLSSSGSVTGLGSDRKNQTSHLSKAKGVRVVGATWNGTYLVQQNPDSPKDWKFLGTGSNSHGQLASSPDLRTTASDLHTLAFPSEALNSQFQTLACGSEHILISLLKSGKRDASQIVTEVWGWGWNEHGNLGLGHTEDVLEPTRIWPQQNLPDKNSRVTGVWAGCGTSWIAVEIDGE